MCILSFSLDMHPVRLQEVQNWQKDAGIFRDHAGENGLLLFGLNLTLVGDWWPNSIKIGICWLFFASYRQRISEQVTPLHRTHSCDSQKSIQCQAIQAQSKANPTPNHAQFHIYLPLSLCSSACHVIWSFRHPGFQWLILTRNFAIQFMSRFAKPRC